MSASLRNGTETDGWGGVGSVTTANTRTVKEEEKEEEDHRPSSLEPVSTAIQVIQGILHVLFFKNNVQMFDINNTKRASLLNLLLRLLLCMDI